jgi:hypothetical protein
MAHFRTTIRTGMFSSPISDETKSMAHFRTSIRTERCLSPISDAKEKTKKINNSWGCRNMLAGCNGLDTENGMKFTYNFYTISNDHDAILTANLQLLRIQTAPIHKSIYM